MLRGKNVQIMSFIVHGEKINSFAGSDPVALQSDGCVLVFKIRGCDAELILKTFGEIFLGVKTQAVGYVGDVQFRVVDQQVGCLLHFNGEDIFIRCLAGNAFDLLKKTGPAQIHSL